MRFANIREMHQPSAVGIAREANVDDRGLYLAAKIVDDEAWEKVVQGVYKGFSIGGRVTARDPTDRSVITGLALTEISVVDRPANPEAVFDCWKASGSDEMHDQPTSFDLTMRAQTCGDSGHHNHKEDKAGGCMRKHDPVSVVGRPEQKVASEAVADTANDANSFVHEQSRSTLLARRWATADELAKVHNQSSELLRLVAELSVVVGHIAKQVTDISQAPLPAQTIAYPHGFTGVSKTEDSGLGTALASDEDIVDRFAKLSPTEQTMLLIKAAYRNPMHPGEKGQADSNAT
jgi:hypothetical protein